MPQAAPAESAGRLPSVMPNVGPTEVVPTAVRTNSSHLRAPSPMSEPNPAIHAPNHYGAVGYMTERLKGRPSFQTDISRARNLELTFKSVAYANELDRLTRTT